MCYEKIKYCRVINTETDFDEWFCVDCVDSFLEKNENCQVIDTDDNTFDDKTCYECGENRFYNEEIEIIPEFIDR